MEKLSAVSVAKSELARLDDVRSGLPDESPLGAALGFVADSVRRGVDVTLVEADEQLSPAMAARLLGVSRTHLYKLLDAGVLPSAHVGRDRRLRMADVQRFEEQQRTDRARLAERFAHADADRVHLLDELTS